MFQKFAVGAALLALATPALFAGDGDQTASSRARVVTVVKSDLQAARKQILDQVEKALRSSLAGQTAGMPALDKKTTNAIIRNLRKDLARQLEQALSNPVKTGKTNTPHSSIIVTTSKPKVITQMKALAIGPDGKPIQLDQATLKKMIRTRHLLGQDGKVVVGAMPEGIRKQMEKFMDRRPAGVVTVSPQNERELRLELGKKTAEIEKLVSRLEQSVAKPQAKRTKTAQERRIARLERKLDHIEAMLESLLAEER